MLSSSIARFTSRVLQWLRRVLWWCMHPRLALVAACVVALFLWIPFFLFETELSVRSSGLVLQWLGLLTAAIGIRDTRRLFGRPTFLESVRNWFSSFPRFGPRTVTVKGDGISLTATVEGKAHIWRGSGANPTIQSRLNAVEENLLSLKQRLEELEGSTKQQANELREKLENERSTRMDEDRKLYTTIESASADGLNLAAVGVVWLAVGITLTTLPNELLYAARFLAAYL